MTKLLCAVCVLLMVALVRCGGDEEAHHREKRAIPKICPDGTYKCPGTEYCVPKCDGTPDCDGGEDEMDCIHNCTCAVNPKTRVKCLGSYKGMTGQECTDLGCCWEMRPTEEKKNNGWGIPHCYRAVGPNIVEKPSLCLPNAAPADRDNCGWKMISDHDCQCQGCCCDEQTFGELWCFPARTMCTRYQLVYNDAETDESARIVGFYSKPSTGTVSHCPGPDGQPLDVYSIENPALMAFLYYREATGGYPGAWLFAPFECQDFNSLKFETNEKNPDAAPGGGGWIEYSGGAWAANTNYVLTCVQYA